MKEKDQLMPFLPGMEPEKGYQPPQTPNDPRFEKKNQKPPPPLPPLPKKHKVTGKDVYSNLKEE